MHRAEIMQLHGAWPDAMEEAQRACERLSSHLVSRRPGMAFYQLAELHRLRGEFAKAEEAYRQASQCGREPQPGLAQLRLAQGQVDAAAAAIRRGMDEASDRVARSKLLAAYVEIMLAARRCPRRPRRGRRAAASPTTSPRRCWRRWPPMPRVPCSSARATPRAALQALRRAWTAWQELEAPYEAARVRVLIGLACRQLGDQDSAEMELDAARWVFRQLDAAPDLARVEALSRKPAAKAAGGLTARELQVLRLVAAGQTNRSIAADLFLSEQTVARHISNILTKLGVPSRAAATAYAYQHHLI